MAVSLVFPCAGAPARAAAAPHRFHGEVASVHVVSQKQVVGFRRAAAHAEELQQVMKLAMDVTHNSDGRAHAVHVALLRQYVARQLAQRQHVALRQRLAVVQAGQPRVQRLAVRGRGLVRVRRKRERHGAAEEAAPGVARGAAEAPRARARRGGGGRGAGAAAGRRAAQRGANRDGRRSGGGAQVASVRRAPPRDASRSRRARCAHVWLPQYIPRTAFIIWFVSFAAAPRRRRPALRRCFVIRARTRAYTRTACAQPTRRRSGSSTMSSFTAQSSYVPVSEARCFA
jgi:hypothetical protein